MPRYIFLHSREFVEQAYAILVINTIDNSMSRSLTWLGVGEVLGMYRSYDILLRIGAWLHVEFFKFVDSRWGRNLH